MAGLNKRTPTYVPPLARRALDRLSKADLMELLWDQAMINSGMADTAPEDEVLQIIRDSQEALRHNGYQGSIRLK